jgi:hypothetical protein
MRHPRISISLAIGFAAVAAAFAQSEASAPANDSKAPTTAPTFKVPRTPDGKPDFTGTYQWPKPLPGDEIGHSNATIFDRKKFAPLKEGGEAFLEPRTGDPHHDEPRDFCMPAGFPGSLLSGNAMQLFQTKEDLVWVHEFQRNTRIIPLDGRPHLTGIEPTYNGDSVGHWEGDTLVIESTNFKRWVLDDYFYTNPMEYRMHSDAVKFTERLRWKTPTTLSWALTVDDPKIFTAPWTQEFEIESKPDWAAQGLYEYVCEENNRCPGGKCEVK